MVGFPGSIHDDRESVREAENMEHTAPFPIRLLSRKPLGFLFLVFVLSRMLLLGAGFAGLQLLPPGKALTGRNLRISVKPGEACKVLEPGEVRTPAILDIWARWDSEWYLLIARTGYDASGVLSSAHPGIRPEDSSGFFPLYPLLIRCFSPLLGGIGAGLLVSNLSLLLSLWLLLALARELWPGEEFIGIGAGLALLCHPLTLFFSAVYSESLYLALSLAAFLLIVRKLGPVLPALLSGAAVLTRPFGLILLLPMALRWRRDRRSLAGFFFVALVATSCLALYLLYSYGLFGDPLACIVRQQRWRGASLFPGWALIRWWRDGPTLHGASTSTIELGFALLLLGLLPAAFRRLPPCLASYLALGIAIPLSSTLWSFGRISSSLFPLYLLLGIFWQQSRAKPLWPFFLSLLSAMVAMACFAAGFWVG